MTQEIKLLPCPCCGSPARMSDEYQASDGEPAVECSECNLLSWTVADWNRRAAAEMNDDIELPPLPASLLDVEAEARAYARAAVESGRTVPSKREIFDLVMRLDDGRLSKVPLATVEKLVHEALSRYGQPLCCADAQRGLQRGAESQPAASGWTPPTADEHLQALAAGDLMALAEEAGGNRVAENAVEVTRDDISRIITAASQPAASAEPVAYLTRNEDGDPAMLFFDRTEAATYCADDEQPEPLYAARAAKEQPCNHIFEARPIDGSRSGPESEADHG